VTFTVPNLVGKTDAEAQAAWSKLAFASIVSPPPCSSILFQRTSPSRVASQNPPAGSVSVFPAPTITVYTQRDCKVIT